MAVTGKIPAIFEPFFKKMFSSSEVIFNGVYGGRNSAKTLSIFKWAILTANAVPMTQVYCFRQIKTSIRKSSFSTVKRLANDEARIGENFTASPSHGEINHRNGSVFKFGGLYQQEQTMRSIDAVDGQTIVIVEEAQQVRRPELDSLIDTFIRFANVKIIFIFNPDYDTDPVYADFVKNSKDPNHNFMKVNFYDNPYMDENALTFIRALKNDNPSVYRKRYLGEPTQGSEGSLIQPQWLDACKEAYQLFAERSDFDTIMNSYDRSTIIGFDPADHGKDHGATSAMTVAKGLRVFTAIDELVDSRDMDDTCDFVAQLACRTRASHICYDGVGIGVGAGYMMANKIRELTAIKDDLKHYNPMLEAYIASHGVLNPDRRVSPTNPATNMEYYKNLRGQLWYMAAEDFEYTYSRVKRGLLFDASTDTSRLVLFSPAIDKLPDAFTELCSVRALRSEDGRQHVESKITMAKRHAPSPNMADAVLHALFMTYKWQMDREMMAW